MNEFFVVSYSYKLYVTDEKIKVFFIILSQLNISVVDLKKITFDWLLIVV